jgi:hypothetical protein
MKRVFSLVLASLVAFGAFAADISVDTLKESIDSALNSGAGKINSGLEDFSKELQRTVPNVQTQQNVYSDAFIGKLFPEIPPHFAAGVNFGITQLNTEGLSDAVDGIQNILNSVGGLTKGLDLDMSVPDSLILPTITADLRIGGLFLPFDFGITAMLSSMDAAKIDTGDKSSFRDLGGNFSVSGSSFSGEINFFTLGFDVRYALLEDSLVLPGLSVGAGYALSKGAVAVSGNASTDSSGVKHSVDADVAVAYVTQTMYLQAQLSKKLFIVTPFVGARALLAWTDNAYYWNVAYTASYSGVSASTSKGADETLSSGTYFIPQLYLGTSINFFFFQTTLSATYDVRDSLFSGALSARFKL